MPTINRIRIVNFSYNHDTRHIIDETFNFHGGENALLNLANGGGKSVLVQLILQVVVPGVKIQGRNISSFFRQKKLPAYIMIEWKLDGGGGYLLTGIGITSAEASEQEGVRPRVRYFNFTSKYLSSNLYDIASIPLIEKNGDVLDIRPFREARKSMADKARKEPYLAGYYAEDEGDGYARRLAEFGIVQDEWRNVIARINDNENGLEDLFQKYRNSSRLLDDWIIKTVEKVMFKGRNEQRQLEEMLQSLVQEVVENEHFITEKQLFTGFLNRMEEMLGELQGLLTDLEEQKKLEANLAALYIYLGGEIAASREQLESNQGAMEAARTEEKRIALEERSYEYLSRKGEHEEAQEKLAQTEIRCQETEDALTEDRAQEKLLRAAELNLKIQQIISELAGIVEKLAMAKQDYDKDERTTRLEYGLKTRYAERLESLALRLADLQAEKIDRQEKTKASKQELHSMETEKSRLDGDKGRLEERLRVFRKREKQVQKRLGRQWIRNLMGELDLAAMGEIENSLREARNRVQKDQEKVAATTATLILRQQAIDDESKEIQQDKAEVEKVLHNHEQELNIYLQKEQEVKGILNRYGFDPALCFDRPRLSILFAGQIADFDRHKDAAARARSDLEEALTSIKNGHLHTSPELAAALAELDIAYDTGESYLGNQTPDLRQQMLSSNPILPYAFILARADLNKLSEAGGLGMVQRRIVPLMAYEDLSWSLQNQGGITRPQEGIAFACLYEGRIFDPDHLEALIADLDQRSAVAAERSSHYTEAHQTALLDLAVCQNFEYSQEFRYEREKAIGSSRKRIGTLHGQLTHLEQEKSQITHQREQLDEKARTLAGQLPQAEETLQVFYEFMDEENDYQSGRGRLEQTLQEMQSLEKRREELRDRAQTLQDEVIALQNLMLTLKKQQQDSEKEFLLYQSAPPAPDEEGSIEELEKRLSAIKQDYNQEIGLLERRQQELADERRKTQKQLDKLALREEDYSSIFFDEALLEALQRQITTLEAVLKTKQSERMDASRVEAGAAMAVDNALAEVKRLGAETPLPLQEIKGNFEERRTRLRVHLQELEKTNHKLSQKLSRYIRARENIEKELDLTGVEAAKDFAPEADMMAQAARWQEDYRRVQAQNRENAGKIRNHYADCKLDYREKNLNLDNIFKGLDPLWDQAHTQFDDYYYLFERMSQHGEKLAELIAIYESQLANLERNKKDMVQQSFLHGRRISEEIQLISDSSKVRLQGRSRPVQMLKIDLQLDHHDAARQRVSDYLEECIARVREKARQESRDDEVRKLVARLISSRELLNTYLGTAHIPISVFKIDINMQNSRLKNWDDAVRENSGGEKFVVFFSLLSALMAYTRARNMEALGGDPDSDTRILIMDNPFGPISSEHLLQPMFEIAKRHRTQLICLSDLKQNSIMNCFNLIYMLKVRTAAIGGDEYLKFEEYVRDETTLHNDEKLEKAVYRVSDFKEMTMFGDDE